MQDLLKFFKVGEKALAPYGGEPAEGMGPVVAEAFPDLDDACVVEYLQMPAEVAVGQGTEFFQIVEQQAFGVSEKGSQDAEASLFMEQPIEAVISESPGE